MSGQVGGGHLECMPGHFYVSVYTLGVCEFLVIKAFGW